jgi:hypothetical protein
MNIKSNFVVKYEGNMNINFFLVIKFENVFIFCS